MASSSSSGSVPNAPRKYDVFISFRGETRNNFTSHLYAALSRAFLEVFRDDKKLVTSNKTKPSLNQAIKNSSVSVIVFSEDYASSKWCLDELDQIMKFRKEKGQYVIPIFYKVDPRDVRKQTGAYRKVFKKHEIDYHPDRVKRWRAALSDAGKLIGKHCQTSTDESNLIEKIVADVSTKLERLHKCQGLESISTKIRYFHWEGYLGKSLPSNFCAELLLELNLEGSKVETLWEGVQDLGNLRRLKLRECYNLRKLPDFSKACSLESVDLNFCWRLSDVHASLLSLHNLISLDVRHCSDLKRLKSRYHLKSLRELEILYCMNLKEFSVSSEELTSLNLSETLIEELSPSIWHCSKLRSLHLVDTKLHNVPIQELSRLTVLEKLSISNLQNIDNVNVRMLFDRLCSLQSLRLIGCCNLTELPDNITQLSNLDRLDLRRCSGLIKLPSLSMRHLSKLQYLCVEGCTALRSLPELPPSLRDLIATDCTSLETVNISTISSTSWNDGGIVFSFTNCVNLDVSAIEEPTKFWLQKAVHEKERVTVSYPGKKVPEWFGNNRTQGDSDTVNLSLSSHTLEGLILCAVVPDLRKEASMNPIIVCNLEWEKIVACLPAVKVSSGHVILVSNPPLAKLILRSVEEHRKENEAAAYNPNLSFKFSFGDKVPTFRAEECGVYPIYASEYSELNPNYRKRKAIMI